MTGNDLFREMGNISEKYVTEAEETKRSIFQNVVFRRSLATAACLVVCVGLYFSTRTGRKADTAADSSGGSAPQYDTAMKENSAVASQEAADGTNGFDFKDILNWGDRGQDKSENTPQEYAPEQDSVSATQDAASENLESNVGSEPEYVVGEIYDEWEMFDRLSAYPNDYEAILETDAFVVVHGTVKSGMDKWNSFIDNVKEGKPAYLELVQFTDEGDAIITAIQYTGDYYHVLADHSRDAWGKTNVIEYVYDYLYLDIQDGRTGVVLTDLELEEEEISEAMNEKPTEFLELVQYGND
ncbi:MAG: DUF4362 domain-containing protein [Lachnospiraceae bacterium]|nr:DUF4362 domain-containing protein [Lachnospiraceae bacterium]